MKKLILIVFYLIFYFRVTAQEAVFTTVSPCGFEFTLSKKFVKSKFFGYYSNSQCFDTVLSNRDGVVIEIQGEDLSKGGRVSDSIDYTGLEIDNYKKGIMQSGYENVDSVIFCSFNHIRFGAVNYHEISTKPKKNFKYHRDIVFFTFPIIVHIYISMKDLRYKNIDKELLKTIRKI